MTVLDNVMVGAHGRFHWNPLSRRAAREELEQRKRAQSLIDGVGLPGCAMRTSARFRSARAGFSRSRARSPGNRLINSWTSRRG